ncbi:MAG: hypothetical protein AAFX93_11440 [Verrucomicrobiota bacterium]
MESCPNDTKAIQALIHDLNGQIFLIRGHAEIAKRSEKMEQRDDSLNKIQEGTDELERLVKAIRANVEQFRRGD